MPLGTRDILLVVRAKDEASGVIRGIGSSFMMVDDAARRSAGQMLAAGSALLSLGAGMTAAGVGLGIMAKRWVDDALAWRQQVGLTLTQLDEVPGSLEDISRIGLRVGAQVPVPLEQIQAGLYDIFSSMDVGLSDAEKILESFSKGSVAGQVDLQAAGRATIAILNAWGLGAGDVNRIMDTQFQLVRKGVGTYEEFASTIGLSIPAAVRSGQSIEDLSGMLAFLTRNGLSASRASTSAGRALEALAHPTVVKRLQDMGIVVRDMNGNFRPVSQIAADLGKSLEGMSDPEIAEAMQELFKGAGGTIQARRFWDLAIRNYDELLQRTDEMQNSAGAMQEAYDVMFNQPQTQIDRFNNLLKIASITLGEVLLPAVSSIVDIGSDFLQWFLDLNPEIHKWVGYVVAGGAALLTFVGALTGFSGMVLILGATIKMLGGISGIIALGAPLLLFFAALAGAAYLIYKNWDEIEPWWNEMWPKIQETARQVWEWIQEKWEELWPRIKEVAQQVWDWLVTNWPIIWDNIKSTAQAIYDWFLNTFNTVWPIIRDTVKSLIDWWNENWPSIRDTVITVWDEISERVEAFIEFIQSFVEWFGKEIVPELKELWASIQENIIPIIQSVIDIVQQLWDYFMVAWPAIYQVVSIWWDEMASTVEFAVSVIVEIVDFMLTTIRGFLDIVAGILTLDWGRVWEGAQRIVSAFNNFLVGILQAIWSRLRGWVDTVQDTIRFGMSAVRVVIEAIWNGIVDFFQRLPGRIVSALGDMARVLYQAGRDVINGLWNGMKDVWRHATDWLSSLNPANWFNDINPYKGHAIKNLVPTGLAVMEGLQRGMQQGWLDTTQWLNRLDPSLEMGYAASGPVGASPTGGTNVVFAEGSIVFHFPPGTDTNNAEQIRDVVYDVMEEVLSKV